jgi:hypothetical protein
MERLYRCARWSVYNRRRELAVATWLFTELRNEAQHGVGLNHSLLVKLYYPALATFPFRGKCVQYPVKTRSAHLTKVKGGGKK